MRCKTFTFALVVLYVATLGLMLIPICGAQGDAQDPPSGLRALDTSGDNPLTTSYIWDGYGGVLVFPLPFDGLDNPAGTLDVTSIPEGSTVAYACFSTTAWPDELTASSSVFNGTPLDTIMPTSNDPAGGLVSSLYNWDVTTLVSGNGSYAFTTSNLFNSFAAYLVIIYENALSPFTRIVINDGAEGLENSSSTTYFSGFELDDGILKILVEAAQEGNGTGEMIEFNGQILAGPGDIFVANLGNYADYFEFNVTNVQYDDTLTITTGDDFFGIHLAILIGTGYMDITLVPFLSPIQVPATGGSFEFYVFVTNLGPSAQTMYLWTEAILPDGTLLTPIMDPVETLLDPGTTGWHRYQDVPARAPAGNYTYWGCLGIYPDAYHLDSFDFEKLETGEGSIVHDWRNWSDLSSKKSAPEQTISLEETVVQRTFPNPFNPVTAISYQLSAISFVNLVVYDVSGRKVAELVNGWRDVGVHEVTFDGTHLASGIYVYRLKAGQHMASGKMLLLK